MSKRAEWFGWTARLLAVMAILGVIGLTGFLDSAPVSATHTRWYTEVKLKCDVTEVEEGDTFSVEGARRLDSDSGTPNIHWEITVRPDGDGEVVVTLPVTTDCADYEAICTDDGRMLSNELVLTVSGPGQ